jgi:glycerol-3-phosphate acyltransferase PlsY
VGLFLAVINGVMTIYVEGGEGSKTTSFFYAVIFCIYYLMNFIPYLFYTIFFRYYEPTGYVSALLNFMTFFVPFCLPYLIFISEKRFKKYRNPSNEGVCK